MYKHVSSILMSPPHASSNPDIVKQTAELMNPTVDGSGPKTIQTGRTKPSYLCFFFPDLLYLFLLYLLVNSTREG